MRKRLLIKLHYTLHIKQSVIIFYLFIYDYAINQRIFGDFLKRNSSRHPTVATLRPAAAAGIGTVLHGFESRPTRATSGHLRAAFSRTPFARQLRRQYKRIEKYFLQPLVTQLSCFNLLELIIKSMITPIAIKICFSTKRET